MSHVGGTYCTLKIYYSETTTGSLTLQTLDVSPVIYSPQGHRVMAMETVEPDLRCMVLGYSPARYSVSWTTTTSIPPTALIFGNKVLIF